MNSLSLFVASRARRLKACAGISRSIAPIGGPDFSRDALISPYASVAAISNDATSNAETNSFRLSRFFLGRALFAAPYCSWASVIAEIPISPTWKARNRCDLRLLLDDVDADIGIQHHLHQKGFFRFSNRSCFLPPFIKSSETYLGCRRTAPRTSCKGEAPARTPSLRSLLRYLPVETPWESGQPGCCRCERFLPSSLGPSVYTQGYTRLGLCQTSS